MTKYLSDIFRMTVCVACAVMVCGSMADNARAGEVSASLSATETYVGLPVQLFVEIKNAGDHDPPELPDIAGVRVESAGPARRSMRTTVINGRATKITSVTYVYTLTPTQPGTVVLPAFDVRVDGEVHRIKEARLSVLESVTNDLMSVDIVSDRQSVYVGESVTLTLRIYLKPYADPRFNFRFEDEHMWSCVQLKQSEWGVFLEPLAERVNNGRLPASRSVQRTDDEGTRQEYYLYQVSTEVWPATPGPLKIDPVNVVVSYPEELGRSRDIFSRGQLTITRSRPLSVSPKMPDVVVKDVPSDNRPVLFRGAVGRYNIDVAAKPTSVAVGDPITLTIAITGTGRLDQLAAPPLADVPALVESFKVPSEPLAGTVDNNVKVFTQTIRARTDEVDQIPAIPFVYFDPATEQFHTVTSDPIAIEVAASEQLSVSQIRTPDGAAGTADTQLTQVQGGILANYADMDEVLTQHAFRPGTATLVVLAAGPVVFLVCFVVTSHQGRLRRDVSFARRRRAMRCARQTLRQASRADREQACALVSSALRGYIADKTDRSAAAVTADTAAELLGDADVDQQCIEQFRLVLDNCELTRFAGGVAGEMSADELIDQAGRILRQLEHARL